MKKTETHFERIDKRNQFLNVLTTEDMLKIRGGGTGTTDPRGLQ